MVQCNVYCSGPSLPTPNAILRTFHLPKSSPVYKMDPTVKDGFVCCRFPHDAETFQNLPRIVPADRCGGVHRCAAHPHREHACLTPNIRHVLPVQAPSNYTGCRLLHAELTFLRPLGHHSSLRLCWNHLQHTYPR